jgi:[protein-PII] uridylyltransferase
VAARVSGLAGATENGRRELAQRLARGEDGLGLGRRNAEMLDEAVRTVFRAGASRTPPGVAVAAVGSHGRGAVALRSDADLCVLVPTGASEKEVAAFAQDLLYPLWDVGIEVGHQVLAPADLLELAQHDLTSATALLDMRHLVGEKSVVPELLHRAYEGLFAEEGLRDLVLRLEEETAARHERFGGSLYLLEPDVKSARGGLRDLDGARWVARARFRVGDAPGDDAPTSPWAELVRLGVLVPREEAEMREAEEFLWRVRNRLHAHAGRRSDRLAFDEQEALAVEMGYAASVSGDRSAAAEAFMRDYYLYARAVTRARERIFERASVPPRRASPVRAEVDLGLGLRLVDGAVTIAGAAELASDPALAMRVYLTAVRQGAAVHGYARGVVARAATEPAWCASLRASSEARSSFVELAATVADAKMQRGSILGELHDAGLLVAMIPEFVPVTGRVHHDVYHVYTVDVHSVASVDCLRALFRGQMAQEQPLASRLAAEVQRPRSLFLATLLHDIGKGYPDASGSRKNHSQSGAELCDAILPRLGLPADEIAHARTLVLLHLAMYHTATRRDLDDPKAIEDFCRPLSGREALRALYLLTVADLSTTSPTAMTSWKARMLEELYLAADAHLARTQGGGSEERGRRKVVADEAARLWSGASGELSLFLESMPDRYLAANDAARIVAHARVSLSRGARPVLAAIVPSSQSGFAELCVVAEDQPGLLANLAGVITAARLEVLGAEVYSRPLPGAAERAEAVDVFWVQDRVDGKAGVERRMPSILRDLEAVCSGTMTAKELLGARTGSSSKWRERPSPAIPTKVTLEDRASPRHTVVEVFAKDRPGLLYALAEAMRELRLTIALSKINTEGARVADVFYVSELDGSKVLPGERYREIREALVRAVEAV